MIGLVLALLFNPKYRAGWLAARGWYGDGVFSYDANGLRRQKTR